MRRFLRRAALILVPILLLGFLARSAFIAVYYGPASILEGYSFHRGPRGDVLIAIATVWVQPIGMQARIDGLDPDTGERRYRRVVGDHRPYFIGSTESMVWLGSSDPDNRLFAIDPHSGAKMIDQETIINSHPMLNDGFL